MAIIQTETAEMQDSLIINKDSSEIDTLSGTIFYTPQKYSMKKFIESKMIEIFKKYGYSEVQVPIIERSDVYIRKSGEELKRTMYQFEDLGGRELCLRPEITALIAHAFVSKWQYMKLPLKFCYCGPAFRFDRPQEGRYRQFTHAGVEIIGPDDTLADAELIVVALRILEQFGLKNIHLKIGHMGFITEFFKKIELEDYVAELLITRLEILSKGGDISTLKNKLEELGVKTEPDQGGNLGSQIIPRDKELITEFFNVYFTNIVNEKYGRDRKDIIERLLKKYVRDIEEPLAVAKALAFLECLTKIDGKPFEVHEEIIELNKKFHCDFKAGKDLFELINHLKNFGVDENIINVNLGFGRGLTYYTGIIFEIDHLDLGGQKQICGGGRYDDLISLYGGKKDTPALGFSFGVERVGIAIKKEGLEIPKVDYIPDIFIAYLDDNVKDYAVKVSEILRKKFNKNIEIELKNRKLQKSLKYANDKGIKFVIIIGTEEKENDLITLKNMVTGLQLKVPIKEITNIDFN